MKETSLQQAEVCIKEGKLFIDLGAYYRKIALTKKQAKDFLGYLLKIVDELDDVREASQPSQRGMSCSDRFS